MTTKTPAMELFERAQTWAAADERVAAALVYGSVAREQTHTLSDLDLLVVAQPNQRDALWREREALAARLLGKFSFFSRNPPGSATFVSRPGAPTSWKLI